MVAKAITGAGTPAAVPIRRRSPFARFSGAHWLMMAAGVAALLANLAFLRQADSSVEIAVASRPLAAGTTITVDDLTPVRLNAEGQVLEGLVLWNRADSIVGSITAGPIARGDLVRRSDLLDAAAPLGFRAMSIPIEPDHAAGGQIVTGDRVDVIGVSDGTASFLVTDAQVLQVSEPAIGGIGGSGSSFVVLAVDMATSLRLAEAMASGSLEVIRSTGAAAVEANG